MINSGSTMISDFDGIKLLGIDPGKTTGWALAEINSSKTGGFGWIKAGDIVIEEFNDFFHKGIAKVDVVVVEDFVIRTNVKDWDVTRLTNNDLYVKGLVGRVEFLCWLHEKRLIKYEAKDKRAGYQLNGMAYPPSSSNPLRHQFDARAHVRLALEKAFGI